MTNITDTVAHQITVNLDRLESNLPALPARVLRLQRAVAARTFDNTTSVVNAVAESTRNFFETTRLSGRTVAGQARAAGDQVANATRTGVRTVTGQARAAGSQVAGTTRTAANTVAGQTAAQGRKVAGSARNETTKLLDDAIGAVEETVEVAEDAVDSAERIADDRSATSRRYEDRTKAELLERAQELDIEGRSQMNKKQLIAALRKA